MSDEHDPPTLRAWDLVGLGGLLLACLVGGLAVGLVIDHASGSSPVFTLVGIAAGLALGLLGSWLRIRRYLDV